MAEPVTRRPALQGSILFPISLAASLIGVLPCLFGAVYEPRQAAFSYLTAIVYALSLAIGTLIFSLIGRVMNAGWPVAIRRLEEAVLGALPALAVLMVPVLLATSYLYIWADPPPGLPEHERHLLDHKRPYLNVPSFWARTVVYLVLWVTIAEVLRRWSLSRERDAAAGRLTSPRHLERERKLAAIALPLVGLSITFAAFDWLMSLQPGWYSTMYGVYYFAGAFLGALALLTVLAARAQRSSLVADKLHSGHFYALGRLLLAFVVFWAYIAYFQSFLIQMANKPEEVTYYLLRTDGGWMAVTYFLIIGHFTLPFLVLLSRELKHRAGVMEAVAIWILFAHYVDVYWLVMPVLHPGRPQPHWLDLTALLAVLGIAAATGALRQRGLSLFPEGHPRLREALMYRRRA